MFYYIFNHLHQQYQLLGASLFQYISFRASLAFILALFIALIYGKKIIKFFIKNQLGEEIRDLGLEGQKEKKGTPTIGGIIIIIATVIPVLFFAKILNVYILLLLVTTIWMGVIGFLDDYIKVYKKNKKGLAGKFKILGQVGLATVVGFVLYFNHQIKIRQELTNSVAESLQGKFVEEVNSLKTTIPFFKNNEFNYVNILSFFGDGYQEYAWLIFIPIVIFIITAVSNATNLTDGLDGLAGGSSIIIAFTLGIFAWVSGNIIFSDYLNIMYIPNVGEITIFIAALIGALVGFLWYNTYPAQIFMGDTGSLTIGGIIAVVAIIIRKELLIPLICGVFFIETLSVMIQVGYFKYTRRKTGKGKRIFLMSPLHHHYQKKGIHESKIVTRFWIAGVVFAVISIITLKLR